MACKAVCSDFWPNVGVMLECAMIFWLAFGFILLILKAWIPFVADCAFGLWRLIYPLIELLSMPLAKLMWKVFYGLIRSLLRTRIPDIAVPANVLVQLTSCVIVLLMAIAVPIVGGEVWIDYVSKMVGDLFGDVLKDLYGLVILCMCICFAVGLALNAVRVFDGLLNLIWRIVVAMAIAGVVSAGANHLVAVQHHVTEAVFDCLACRVKAL